MNQDHKTKVIAQLDPFWQLDIDKRIAEAYKDYTDLSSIMIGYYSVAEISTVGGGSGTGSEITGGALTGSISTMEISTGFSNLFCSKTVWRLDVSNLERA